MTEAELLEIIVQGGQTVFALVSLYFAAVSAYVAALYYILARCRFMLKMAVFTVFTMVMAFLGISALILERIMLGAFQALVLLPERAAGPSPHPDAVFFGFGAVLSRQYEYVILIAWGLIIFVYIWLTLLTFIPGAARHKPAEPFRS